MYRFHQTERSQFPETQPIAQTSIRERRTLKFRKTTLLTKRHTNKDPKDSFYGNINFRQPAFKAKYDKLLKDNAFNAKYAV